MRVASLMALLSVKPRARARRAELLMARTVRKLAKALHVDPEELARKE
jgi:hypothetical protein